MQFSSFPCSVDLKDRLIRSVRDSKVPHALLFQGKTGALNLPLALAFSTYLHCEQRTETDSCGTCASCTLNRKFIHPDTHFAYPVGNMKSALGESDDDKVRNDLLKTWREFLLKEPFGSADDWLEFYGGQDKQPSITREAGREIIRALSLKPFQSQVKVMLIWQPEMMHPSAANGLLKILEEPPPHTYFLLVSSQAQQLLPTILSRTQIVTVPLTADDDIRAQLRKNGVSDGDQMEKAIGLAEGDLNSALHLVREVDGPEVQLLQEFLRCSFRLDPSRLLPMSEEFHSADRMDQRIFMEHGLMVIRETLLALSGAEHLHRARGSEQEFIRKFSAVMSINRVGRLMTLFNDSLYQLERNGSAKMIFMDLALSVNKAMQEP